ncbi:hypothetical protein [Actinosynnema sp.]|uniref:hypothetical protein n=1 Tax=Actinosynnema sp. TaxID=1872144 RepID=UPI003F87DFD5
MEKPKIGALSFLDYAMSTPKGCAKIVKEQRRMYSDLSSQGHFTYESIKIAMKQSVDSADPRRVLDKAVDKAPALLVPTTGKSLRGSSPGSPKRIARACPP